MTQPEVRRASRVYLPDGNFSEILSVTEMKRAVSALLPIVVNNIVMRHDWPFALDNFTRALAQGETEIKLDDDQDITQVHSVRYVSSDSGFVLLSKKSQIQMDDILTSQTLTIPTYWTHIPRQQDSFPRIAILAGAEDATHSLTYRYWKRLSFIELPEEFHGVVLTGLKARFYTRFKTSFEHEMRVLIDEFTNEDPDADTVRLDKRISGLHNRRTRTINFGG